MHLADELLDQLAFAHRGRQVEFPLSLLMVEITPDAKKKVLRT